MSDPKLEEQDLKFFKDIFNSHMAKSPSLLNSSKNQDIVIFLGSTGSGKSTLLNFLSGIPLVIDEDSELQLAENSYPGGFSIGKSSISETTFPQFVSLNGSVYYDMPGFEESRGGCIDLMNACFIKNIIENATSVKIAVVVGQDEITAGRGKRFLKSYNGFKNLIASSICIENPSVLVITKSSKTNKTDLVKYLSAKVMPSDLDGFRVWINNERILPFSNKLETNEKLCIFQAISDLEPITGARVDIRPIFASDVRHQVKLIIENEFTFFFKKLNLGLMNLQNSLEEIEEQIKYFRSGFEFRIGELIASSELLKILESLSPDLVNCECYAFQGQIQKIKYKSLQRLKLIKAQKHIETYILQEKKLRQDLESKNKNLENRCVLLQGDNNNKEQSEKSMKKDIAILKEKIKALQKENKSYLCDLSAVKNENNELLGQFEEISYLARGRRQKIESMETQIISYESERDHLSKENITLRIKIERNIKSTKNEINKLENERELFRKSTNLELNTLTEKIDHLSKENITLRMQIERNIKSTKNEINKLENERELFRKSTNLELNTLTEKINNSEKERLNLIALNDNFNKRITTLGKEREKLVASNNYQSQKISNIEKENINLVSSLNNLRQEFDNLQTEKKFLEDYINSIEARNLLDRENESKIAISKI